MLDIELRGMDTRCPAASNLRSVDFTTPIHRLVYVYARARQIIAIRLEV